MITNHQYAVQMGVLGGHIGAVSRPGFGSVFWFCFPAEEAHPGRRAPLGRSPSCAAALSSRGAPAAVPRPGAASQRAVEAFVASMPGHSSASAPVLSPVGHTHSHVCLASLPCCVI